MTSDPHPSALAPTSVGATSVPAMRPIALSIAGFDPSGGAGILADIKTFAAHGVYGMACITALTVQSTLGVQAVEPISARMVNETLLSLSGDVRFAAIKIGMLATGEVAGAVAAFLKSQLALAKIPIVLDPILHASSGAELLDVKGQAILRKDLLALVDWITPNLLELAALTGQAVAQTCEGAEASGQVLLEMAARLGNPNLRVVVTGGHAARPNDLLMSLASGSHWFPGKPIATQATHGTGCTFSSALAARLALGNADRSAVEAAKAYVAGAMRAAYPIGQGKGPVDHFWNFGRGVR